MTTRALTIGEFSRLTYLSAKALRFYHREGLLVPRGVDSATGYREYDLDQLATAQVIRRFRELDMPIDTIRRVLTAADIESRNALIAEHLTAMEAQLADTMAAVTSLRELLVRPEPAVTVEHRSLPATPVLMISETIDLADLGEWYTEAFRELDAVVARSALRVAGPRGGMYATELFLDERGEASVYRPIELSPGDSGGLESGRVQQRVLPPTELAIVCHRGPDIDIDRSYAALGDYVKSHEIGVGGPIRESYLVSEFDADAGAPVTEIGWPIFRTAE